MSIGTLSSMVTDRVGQEAVEFHKQRMVSIAAELDEFRRSPIPCTAKIDEHVRLLAHHRAQVDAIEETLRERM